MHVYEPSLPYLLGFICIIIAPFVLFWWLGRLDEERENQRFSGCDQCTRERPGESSKCP